MKSKTKRVAGRPTEYRPEYVEQVERLCRIGAIDTDIAEAFNVHVDTIYEWKKVYPDFSEAIKKGKSKADQEIAEKLYQRAHGARTMQQKEVKLKKVWYKDGRKYEEERVKVINLEAIEAPDTAAIIFFLKNRRPDLWKDKRETDLTTKGDKIEGVQVYLPEPETVE